MSGAMHFMDTLLYPFIFSHGLKIHRVKRIKNSSVLVKTHNDIINRLCYLSPECLTYDYCWVTKTEGDYISPLSYIRDTTLLGHECLALQQRLARSLDLPPPERGRCNIHCGIIVHDGGDIYQIAEYISFYIVRYRRTHDISISISPLIAIPSGSG